MEVRGHRGETPRGVQKHDQGTPVQAPKGREGVESRPRAMESSQANRMTNPPTARNLPNPADRRTQRRAPAHGVLPGSVAQHTHAGHARASSACGTTTYTENKVCRSTGLTNLTLRLIFL